MHDYLMVEDKKLWDIVLDGPFIPTIEVKEGEKQKLCRRLDNTTTKLTERKLEKLQSK